MKTVPKRCSTDGNAAARTFQKSYQAAVWSLLAGTPPPLDIRGRKNGTLSHSSLFFGQMPLWKYYMNFDNMLAKLVTLQHFRCLYEGTLLSLWHNCLLNLAVEMNWLTLIFLQLFFSQLTQFVLYWMCWLLLCVARPQRGRYAQKALAKPLGLTVYLVFLLQPVTLACVRFQAESGNYLACFHCYF